MESSSKIIKMVLTHLALEITMVEPFHMKPKPRNVEKSGASTRSHNQFSDPRRQQKREEHQAIADVNRKSTINHRFLEVIKKTLDKLRNPQPPVNSQKRIRSIETERDMAEAAIKFYEKKRNTSDAQSQEKN